MVVKIAKGWEEPGVFTPRLGWALDKRLKSGVIALVSPSALWGQPLVENNSGLL